MCGRYTQFGSIREILSGADFTGMTFDMAERYNIAPSMMVAVFVNDGGYKAREMKWGLVPSWSNDVSIGNKIINARSETLLEKPTFKHAIRKRRCLIPADGFYEWHDTGAGKQPYYIRMKSQKTFCFAGMFDTWKSPDGTPLVTCTIITTECNDLLRPIHHRMPVILHRNDYEAWLDPSTDISIITSLLVPFPSDDMEIYPVSKMVNSPRNDGAELIRPNE
jgi:putative SOS response-associated peptidase YedK